MQRNNKKREQASKNKAWRWQIEATLGQNRFCPFIRQLTYKIKGSLSDKNDGIHWESYDILLWNYEQMSGNY